ncbi:MAG: DUF4388 domain-containing protein [Nitrospirae bacterium]|nr:DUF4388 domain-containing protein [Nitrospirota bacterium]
MALEGSLRDFGLADILQLIYFQKKTGILALRGKADQVRLMFHEGNIISAESRKRVVENRIGKILLKKGLIRENDLKTSLEEQKSTGARLGDIFLKNGVVQKEDIRQTLISQMTETVVQLFSWKEGTYEFQGQPVPLSQDMPVTLDTQHLLMEGLRVLDEWALVEGRITLDTVFEKTGEKETSFTSDEESILRYVDGENDVSIVLDLSGVDDFQASRVLVSLMEKGVIAPVKISPVVSAEAAPVMPEARKRSLAGVLVPVVFFGALALSLASATLQASWSHKGIASFLGGNAEKRSRTVKEIEALRFMAEASLYKNGSYPADLGRIGAGRDAWGRPFLYRIENNAPVIFSAGPDGKAGTSDDIY